MKDKFQNYKPEQINAIVIVITDRTIYDEATDKQIPEVLKDQTDANVFMDKLQAFCKEYGFQIDGTGSRAQMAARLYKKDGKSLITEEDAIKYASDCHESKVLPTLAGLDEFILNLRDMK